MKNKGRGLVLGDWLFTRHGAGDIYATDGTMLYRKMLPGCYYLIKGREQTIGETVVLVIRMVLFVFVFWLLGALSAVLTVKGFFIWLLLFLYVRIGGGR